MGADFLVDVFEHGDAPAAAGAGGETFGDLGGVLGFFDGAEGFDLPEADVEAKTDCIVGFQRHEVIIPDGANFFALRGAGRLVFSAMVEGGGLFGGVMDVSIPEPR